MTILKCSATKCLYNENELCSRGDIEITGDNAHRADETNCEKINIDCKAQECTYNDQRKCTASAIDVVGCSTDGCNETKCNTFSCKC